MTIEAEPPGHTTRSISALLDAEDAKDQALLTQLMAARARSVERAMAAAIDRLIAEGYEGDNHALFAVAANLILMGTVLSPHQDIESTLTELTDHIRRQFPSTLALARALRTP